MDMEIITKQDEGRAIYKFLEELHDELKVDEKFLCNTDDNVQKLILDYVKNFPDSYLIVFAFFGKFIILERTDEDLIEYRRINEEGLMNMLSIPFCNIVVERIEELA